MLGSNRLYDAQAAAINAEMQREIAQLGDGYATDWGDYNKRVGRIRGLNDALAIMDAVRAKIMES